MRDDLTFDQVCLYIAKHLQYIHDHRNDGWSARHHKLELYKLKCFVDDEYNQLPKFLGEEEWEQERLLKLLKK